MWLRYKLPRDVCIVEAQSGDDEILFVQEGFLSMVLDNAIGFHFLAIARFEKRAPTLELRMSYFSKAEWRARAPKKNSGQPEPRVELHVVAKLVGFTNHPGSDGAAHLEADA